MLRALVVALLVANLGYWAWSHGLLPGGWLPAAPDAAAAREPQRLAAQLRPESIELLPAAASAPSTRHAAPPRATTCLQAGPFDDAAWGTAWAAAERAGLLTEGWMRATVNQPPGGAWLRIPAASPALAERLAHASAVEFAGGFLPCP